MKKSLTIIFFIIFNFIAATNANAAGDVVSKSAEFQFRTTDAMVYDERVDKLQNFLKKYNSPLSGYAKDFITAADKYQLDWRLVPSITGVESTFGKRIPPNSFNAYGWANGDYKFKSWEDSIEIVSKTLREKYLNKGASTIDKIARRYAPPSSTWGFKVEYFMNKIDPTPLVTEFDL